MVFVGRESELQALERLYKHYEQRYFYLFSKGGFSEGTKNKAAERNDLFLVSAEDLFEGLLS